MSQLPEIVTGFSTQACRDTFALLIALIATNHLLLSVSMDAHCDHADTHIHQPILLNISLHLALASLIVHHEELTDY